MWISGFETEKRQGLPFRLSCVSFIMFVFSQTVDLGSGLMSWEFNLRTRIFPSEQSLRVKGKRGKEEGTFFQRGVANVGHLFKWPVVKHQPFKSQ